MKNDFYAAYCLFMFFLALFTNYIDNIGRFQVSIPYLDIILYGFSIPNIIKASGEIAPFEPEKLRRSLSKIGTDPALVEQIVKHVTFSLHEGMSTREIYRIAFRQLRTASRTTAAKYHLKHAIMRFGITGYPLKNIQKDNLLHLYFQKKQL